MALDSKAAFKERALEVGITNADITALETGGIATYSQFAFCCAYSPGAQSDAPLLDHLEEVLGTKPTDTVDCFSSVMQWS